MPLYRWLPKRGFNTFKSKSIAIINLSKIQKIIEKKINFTDSKVNLSLLQKHNQINKKFKKIKLLGAGDIKNKFDFEVNFISNSAKDKIEKIGGKVTLVK